MPRDTRTGAVLESMAISALGSGGYRLERQVLVGERLGGRPHRVDAVAVSRAGSKYLLSFKWQQGSGTAEQKVPFEVICLCKAVRDSEGEYEKAYLVLGGEGWTLRDFYIGGGLREYVHYEGLVEIMSLEAFVARANRGNL